MIEPVTVQKIKDTADIVDVVSDYVHLVRRGANYMGLCPFHNERTPSFSVNRSRNFCYCFSCHKGGSPVSFIMEKEGISYYDALKQLARKYGIEVRERELTDEERETQSRREGMFVANEWAKNHFIENLSSPEGQSVGLSYLYGRKVTSEAVKAFQLGYSLDNFKEFTEAALKKGFSVETLKQLGLTGTTQQGNYYDRFKGRIIFPILNSSGKTVGFGGRDLKGAPAKYINSPESEIYSKSRELYGIFQAKGAMVREDKCYLVEGYLDVIGLWQSGVQNVVASSGTALTDGQISLIHRFTNNVTLIYDGDSAGIKASLRGIDMLLAHNLNVSAVPLPEGEDPDSLAAKLSPEELKQYLKDNETDIIRFKIRVMLEDAKEDPQKKWQAVRSIVQSIAHVGDKIKRDIYIQECSQLLEIKESTLSSEVAKMRHSIIEQEKLKRRSDELKRDFPTTTPNPNIVSEKSEISISDLSLPEKKSRLYHLEHNLLINCLKFGFIPLWYAEEENDDEEFTTVIEYVAEELEIDNISFSIPDFSSTFKELMSLLTPFRKDFKDFRKSLFVEIEDKRRRGNDEISCKSLSIQEIKREETKLEESLENHYNAKTDEFCRNYIFDKFGSHENSIIRNLTNESVIEKHQLSSLFSKIRDHEKSGENILSVINSSLNILKNGIIDCKLKQLMNDLRNLNNSDPEKEKEIHKELVNLMQIRSNMAKDIGDRILCPQSFNNNRKNFNS